MASFLRPAALVGIAGLLLLTGCATSVPGGTPTSTTLPDADGGRDADDFEGALLDDGRMFAVVTWGSSTCVPQVEEVIGTGQNLAVTLTDVSTAADGEQACTKDLAPRASVGALPDGVDTSSEITLEVTYGDLVDQVDLDGGSYTGTPGTPTEYAPSAAWFDDGALVLLTWGSSSCPPVVESVEGSGAEGTVTFATDDEKVCTMDMAARATIVDFGEDSVEDEGPFTLTLVGGGLEGTVEVR